MCLLPAPAWHNLHIQPEIAASNGRFARPLPRIPQMFQPVRDFWNVSCCRAYDSRGGYDVAAGLGASCFCDQRRFAVPNIGDCIGLHF